MRRGGRHRKDSNHDAVVQALAQRGIGWFDTSQADIGIDGFAIVAGRMVPCEIKDPESWRGLTLSANEEKTHRALKGHGVIVEVLTGDNESLNVLQRMKARDFYDPARNTEAARPAPEAGTGNAGQDPA